MFVPYIQTNNETIGTLCCVALHITCLSKRLCCLWPPFVKVGLKFSHLSGFLNVLAQTSFKDSSFTFWFPYVEVKCMKVVTACENRKYMIFKSLRFRAHVMNKCNIVKNKSEPLSNKAISLKYIRYIQCENGWLKLRPFAI